MRRDWDVMREIMLELEDAGSVTTTLNPSAVEDHPRDLVCYNMILLKEAGLAEGSVRYRNDGNADCKLLRLTFSGHELLDEIRPKPVWEKIKSYSKEHGVELSLNVVKMVAPIVLQKMLNP
ncbi:MAG: DUF2513 domain-containing protein [Gammaproteobacteria bacterium]